ncbi:MAG: RloB domain-containing protein, partial [Bacteroidaceae bacterium]|nr:RloB domain-containing protein [Bacteroidaceae bacterium]
MARKIDIKQQRLVIPRGTIELSATKSIRCKVLIVCEGAKTEPLYFRSFNMMRNSSSLVFEVNTAGGGINTTAVVDKAIALKAKAERAGQPYDAVWAVFDRDNFPARDFNLAISMAEREDIGCAWSNEAFELWYLYHFNTISVGMNRVEYARVITERVRKSAGNRQFEYAKNSADMRQTLAACGCDEQLAIRRAEKQAKNFDNQRYHEHNPCTMVYKLVKQLRGEDREFVELIQRKLEEALKKAVLQIDDGRFAAQPFVVGVCGSKHLHHAFEAVDKSVDLVAGVVERKTGAGHAFDTAAR